MPGSMPKGKPEKVFQAPILGCENVSFRKGIPSSEREGGGKKDDETLPVITHLFSKKFWLRCSHPSASEFIVHSAHPATAFEKLGTGITGARPLLGGWSSVSHEKKCSTKTYKNILNNCLEYVYAFQKDWRFEKKHIPAKLNTRWFKSWPFNPILGGHLASERVT